MVEQILFGPGGATEAKQDDIIALLTTAAGPNALRVDYTGGPTATDPVYLATGPRDAAESDPFWTVYKFSYDGTNLIKIEPRIAMAWDDRAIPTPPWD
jgi:hypothetical protein